MARSACFSGGNGRGAILIFLGLFVFYFFRDPQRKIPADPNNIVAPADGHVVEIVDEMLDSVTGHRISIFLAIWDVHVQRAPVAGRIADVVYRPGKFYAAFRSAASRENEQNIIYIDTPQGRVVFKQIAGAIARRVLCWKSEGEMVALGERVGMIRFGSRVDVWLPAETRVVVRRGQNGKGRRKHPGEMEFNDIDPIGHEEEPRRVFRNHRLRRGIYLLPSAFTVANLLCGYYAILATLEGTWTDFDHAACAIGFAILFDSLDGRVARAMDTKVNSAESSTRLPTWSASESRLPFLAYAWGVRALAATNAPEALHLTQLGWLIGFFFLGCCAWRLARFNIQGMAPGGNRYFVGMPTPAAAGMIAAVVHAFSNPICRTCASRSCGCCWF